MRNVLVSDLEDNPTDFIVSATWCGPCKQMKQVFKELDVPYIDADIDEDYVNDFFRDNKLSITSYPTLVTYNNKFKTSDMSPMLYLKMIKKDLESKQEIQFEEK